MKNSKDARLTRIKQLKNHVLWGFGCTLVLVGCGASGDNVNLKQLPGIYTSTYKGYNYRLALQPDGKFSESVTGKKLNASLVGKWICSNEDSSGVLRLDLDKELYPKSTGGGFKVGSGSYYVDVDPETSAVSFYASESKSFLKIK